MKIPTLLGLSLLVIALGLGLFIFNYREERDRETRVLFEPKNITVVNITDSGVTIIWQTDNFIEGAVFWGETSALSNLKADYRDLGARNRYTIHFAIIKSLRPDTEYFYKIQSGPYLYPNQLLKFRTAKMLMQGSTDKNHLSKPVLGTVVDDNYKPIGDALVTLRIEGAADTVGLTSPNGNFLLTTNNLLNADLSLPFTIKSASEGLILIKEGESQSLIKISLPPTSQPLPLIVIGQDADFTKLLTQPKEEISLDVNDDGVINSIDLSIAITSFGEQVRKHPADVNQDGIIDQKDVDLIKQSLH